MKRRDFMLAMAATSILPLAAGAEAIDYVEGLVQERLDAGEIVFITFKTDWCTTCRAQERVINALKADNPAYGESITFVDVDYDEFGRGTLANRLNVPRRSTLIVLQGDQELGRIVAGTSQRDIQALMNTALTAASA